MRTYVITKKDAVLDWSVIPTAAIDNLLWTPQVDISAKAQVCYDEEALYVRLSAHEAYIRAEEIGDLGSPCLDSCLEFFLAPDSADARYLNFEWNPLGNLYLGFGSTRPTRVRQIVGDKNELFRPEPYFTDGGWGIVFCIPYGFIRNYFPDFEPCGEMAGNFYKCGDETEFPHYLSWMPMSTDIPDFHRRQDFGRLLFE